MIAAVLIALELAAAAVLAWQSIAHINRMTRRTRGAIAAAWVAVGGAAVSMIADLLATASASDWRSVMLVAACAVLSLADRRSPR